MPFVSGFLRFTRRGGQVDNSLPGGGGEVDNSLPDGGYVDNGLPDFQPGIDNSLPGYGGLPPMAGNLPSQPPHVWPPLRPSHPIEPTPPGTPPGTIWPSPGAPDRPDNSLPRPPGVPDQGLPSKTYWVIAGIPGIGWRYIAIDPSLKPGHALPPAPPIAQPKG